MTTSDWHPGQALTEAEEAMCRSAQAGGWTIGSGGPCDLAAMRTWGTGWTVRASVLRHLLVNDVWPVHERGLQLRGLHISGQLDLSNARLRCPARFECCYLPTTVVLTKAIASMLIMNKCHVAGVVGDLLKVTGYLDFADSTFTGPLRLPLADIMSGLNCRGCHLSNPGEDGNVLSAERIKVGSDIFLDTAPGGSNFTANGTLHLLGADIAGNLSLVGAKLAIPRQGVSSLNTDQAKVGGSVFLTPTKQGSSFTADGTVSLVAANINGVLDCSGASLGGGGGDSLVGAGMKVGRSVSLGNGLSAAAAIDLRGAEIGGNLDCREARLDGANADKNALNADLIKVSAHVLLDNINVSTGAVYMRDADVSGNVELRGARLNGTNKHGNALDGERMKVGSNLHLDRGVRVAGTVWLLDARVAGQLSCRGAQLVAGKGKNSLFAERITVGGDVFLDTLEGDRRFLAVGAIWLYGAEIRGNLSCTGAWLAVPNEDGNCLVAEEVVVGGGIYLDRGFVAAGGIRMLGARIGGNLNCWGARLERANSEGNALYADRVAVGGHILLTGGFAAVGTIWLLDAQITGNLECRGAHMRLSHGANSMYAERMRVGGDVYLDATAGGDGFSSIGSIYLLSATIGGVLSLRGACLRAPARGSQALFAERVRVGGNVHLSEGLIAHGDVVLRGAAIDGSLEIALNETTDDAQFTLDASGISVSGTLRWRPERQVYRCVMLEWASLGQLEDSWIEPDGTERPNGYWPTNGQLHLNGLTYNSLTTSKNATVDRRLKWIRYQYGPDVIRRWEETLDYRHSASSPDTRFTTQPYRQLTYIYQQAGMDAEARKVAIAQRRDLHNFGHLAWYRKIFDRLLDFFIGYGYQTWKSFAGLVLLFAFVFAFVLTAQGRNAFIPVQDTAFLIHPKPTAVKCEYGYPCFSPFGYTVDTVIPLINVHQADFWGPNARGTWGWAAVVVTYLGTGFGWLLATFAVAGATGIVRKGDQS